jgi:hypothetical protein
MELSQYYNETCMFWESKPAVIPRHWYNRNDDNTNITSNNNSNSNNNNNNNNNNNSNSNSNNSNNSNYFVFSFYKAPRNCYFHGHVERHEDTSIAAISSCDGFE